MFIANYLNKTLSETACFRHYKMKHNKKTLPPMIDLLLNHKLALLRVICLTPLVPVITLTVFAWILKFSVKHLHLPISHAMGFNCGALLLFIIGAPIFGALSDRWGRKWVLCGISAFFLLFSYPLFQCLGQTESKLQFFLIQGTLAFASSVYYGVAMTTCIEHVPTHVRYTGVAVGYYINYALLASASGDYLENLFTVMTQKLSPIFQFSPISSPVFYLMAASFIVFISSFFLKEEAHRALSDKYS
jgi:MHS family proline/betaine transporter-like MFS transporter